MYLLGLDVGSSSVKASILEITTGKVVASAFSPDMEMEIKAPRAGWAEQAPAQWIEHSRRALDKIRATASIDLKSIQAIGISYQMHGLVLLDKQGAVLRPAIIWCDSRAVDTGRNAFNALGADYCLENLLNSPGNFTASKLKWVQDHEPEVYARIHKAMLPGDYLAYYLTGEMNTTASGLSEGIFWNFRGMAVDDKLLHHYQIDKTLLPETVETFSVQGLVTARAAREFGLPEGIPVAYRAGDQPNNAFSLNVLHPGEIAATAGTSGVVYGVTDRVNFDVKSRVNTFLHVNNTIDAKRLGILLCLNATGISYAWLRRMFGQQLTYPQMNQQAESIAVGSEGLLCFPFGNGAERLLENRNVGGRFDGLNLNLHGQAHWMRAVQEGIAFSFQYGIEIMHQMGMAISTIKAGDANLFLSPVFRETLAGVTGANIEIFNTDGAAGAARGAGVGAGIYSSFKEAFTDLTKVKEVNVEPAMALRYQEAYQNWKQKLY